MSERFEKIVNAPHRAFGRATKRILETEPETKKGKVVRGLGMTITGMTQFLLWVAKYIALDNHITRAGERALGTMQVGKNKKGQDKKLQAFAKKYPNLSSHILYYLMLAMVAGGVKAYDNAHVETNDDVKKVKSTEINKEKTKAEVPEMDINTNGKIATKPNTYGAYLARVQPLTPYLIADLIAKEGVHVDKKTGLHTPYRDSNKYPTIGFGSISLMDGTSVTMNTPPITTEEAYELARRHLITETFFIMYCYDIAHNKININTPQEAMSIGSVIYNSGSKLIEEGNDYNHKARFALLREDFKKYGYDLPDSLVVKRFKEYPVQKSQSFGKAWMDGEPKHAIVDKLGNFLKDGAGLHWRRWIEAGLMTGDIKPELMLNCPINAIYEFYKLMGGKRSNFFTGNPPNRHVNRAAYAEFNKWLKNPVDRKGNSLAEWIKVSDYMPADVVAACKNGKCKLGNTNLIDNIELKQGKTVTKAVNTPLYDDAIDAFKKQDYKVAAQKFERLIADNPNNAMLHNDIAATYNKLGRYNDAIEHAGKVIFEIKDKKQFAAAYYNAGYAYEQLGNLQKALANYKLAVENGNSSVQRDVTRVSNQLKKDKVSKTQSVKSKRTAFNAASGKVQNSFIRKLNIKNNNTNNVA